MRIAYGAEQNETDAAIEEQIVQLKYAHPSGEQKIRGRLWTNERGAGGSEYVGEILRRKGLSTAAQAAAGPLYSQPYNRWRQPISCGARTQGMVLTGKGERVDTLTMTDAHSRYLLRCQHVEKTDTEHVRAMRLRREYGLPETIRTDNGAPFASRSIAGISRLSIDWMKLGIQRSESKQVIQSKMGVTSGCIGH